MYVAYRIVNIISHSPKRRDYIRVPTSFCDVGNEMSFKATSSTHSQQRKKKREEKKRKETVYSNLAARSRAQPPKKIYVHSFTGWVLINRNTVRIHHHPQNDNNMRPTAQMCLWLVIPWGGSNTCTDDQNLYHLFPRIGGSHGSLYEEPSGGISMLYAEFWVHVCSLCDGYQV